MESQPSCAATSPAGAVPDLFIGDDATSTDQLALAVVELLGRNVVTTDADALRRGDQTPDRGDVRVINSRTRALSRAESDALNRFLAARVFAEGGRLPVIQIDSRLRGIGNALRGVVESLDFDFLLFVPAEPELNRFVRHGVFFHAEAGRLIPFHQSTLANGAEPPPTHSDLRDWLASELGDFAGEIVSVDEDVVSQGPDAVASLVRGLGQRRKVVVVPDVTRPEHFEAIALATRAMERARILIAGSRTFLRSLLACVGTCDTGKAFMKSLSQAIDRRKRGAPLAVVSSLESAMNAQIEYARRALGANLVTVDFDSRVVLADDRHIRQEIERVRQLVLQALTAMRPVLLQTARTAAFADPRAQQRHVEALGEVLRDGRIQDCLTSLFVSGGQTVETVKASLGISAFEIRGAFQEGVPWGVPLQGSLKGIPLVTKGGRMGGENVLFAFLEQGHPLPRANILPVVTPLTPDRQVDAEAIEKLIAHLVRLGTTDIFAVGNAGEFRFLTNRQRLEAIEVFARTARGRLRVFAGITGDTAEETRSNYEAVSRLGVHAAVVMPLFFLESSDEIVPFVESLGPLEPKVPLVLYNNPERTRKQNISFEAVEALRFPVVAIKDSSGDLDRLDRYARAMPVYEGQQRQFLEGHQHGARGAVAIIGHVSAFPNEFFAPIASSARREEIARQINDLSKTVKQGGAEVAAYKYLLSLMGVMGDTVASHEPARELTAEQREQIRTRNAELIVRMRG